jgi:regulator of sigma E protease
MAGEDEASADENAFCNKPVWKRFVITVAGAVMNILLGIICMFTLVGVESAERGYLVSTTIGGFMENSTSNILTEENKNPLQVGDTIVKVEGVSVHTGNEIAYEIMHVGHKPVDLVVIRNGKEIVLENVVFPRDEQSGVVFGSHDFLPYAEEANFGNIMKHAVFRSFSTVKVIIDSLVDLVGGRYGAESVSGPIGMAGAVGEASQAGFTSILYLFTLITMNLGIFNLLPFPALDGGRLVFLAIEAIRRKPLPKNVEAAVNAVGMILLLGLVFVVAIKDVFTVIK